MNDTQIFIEQNFNLDNIQNFQSKDIIKKTLVDCFGLLKSLEIEGDIEFDKNSFYQRLLPEIA